jgi:glutamate-5-semialdehyde dehydrogenase
VSDLKDQIYALGRRARAAARTLSRATAAQKNEALLSMAREIRRRGETILSANSTDVDKAKAEQLSNAMIDRLTLNPKRLEAMAQGIEQVAALPDPVGQVISEWTRPNGLRITKVRVPIGVIGIIYESRPNVTSDAAILCTKTGNATILRGGSESIYSNLAIAEALQSGAASAELPADVILLVPTTDREAVRHMAQMDQFIDLIIPRGGHALIEAVVNNARMPVIKHYHGVCIVYVDKDADLAMAESIVTNAKCQRPGVCNAMETVLVHRNVAADFFEKTGRNLMARGVEIRGDDQVRKILGEEIKAVTEEDWTTEFLDLKLAARVVDDMDEAIEHIDRFGSHHSDCIVTANPERAEKFLNEVDSATVYWNASTRFTDGGQFGFGAEIGISTDKIHARGPMALEELTTYKYLIRGSGQIRE